MYTTPMIPLVNVISLVQGLLPPANEVAERECFHGCPSVILSTGEGGGWVGMFPVMTTGYH